MCRVFDRYGDPPICEGGGWGGYGSLRLGRFCIFSLVV